MALTKVTLIQDGVITAGHLHANHGITTDTIGEGANKFYTDARVAQYLSANNYQTAAAGYITGITHDLDNKTLTFTKSNSTSETVNLMQYIDDTNLARLTSGTVDAATGIATFTRDDATTFTVDFSSLLDDTNDYVSSASFNALDGVLTLSRLGGGTVTVDLDGRYLTSETDSQTLSWVDATNTLSISNGNSVTLTGFANASHTHLWADITDKPTTFTPSSHEHTYIRTVAGTTTADAAMPNTGYALQHFLAQGPSGNDGHTIGMTWTGTSAYGAQIWIDTDPNNIMAFRSRSNTGVWTGWNTLVHSGNIGSQSVAYASNSGTLDGLDSTAFMRAQSLNGYYGLMDPAGSNVEWIRTTSNGLIPYSSGGASALGTSSWPFQKIYGNDIYDNGTLLESKYLGISAKAADSNLLDGLDSSAFYLSSNPSGYVSNGSDTILTYVHRIHSSDGTSPDDFGYGNRYQTFNYGVSSGVVGPLLSFGGLGSNYPMQITGAYSGGGNSFKVRTRNGDTAAWNSWRTLITDGNIGSQSVSYASTAGNADTVDGLHESTFARRSANAAIDMNGYHIYDVDRIETQGENKDVKLSVWNGTTYGIGMTSGVTFGHLNDYAMTFCMNNDSDRGFWWGYSGQGKSAGAMSLTTGGNLYVNGRVDSPIFYDSNNTGYYVDPASSARVLKVECGYNHGVSNSIGCSDWFRSTGATGWYNASYGGGIYMSDSTWVRTYNDKKFYVSSGSGDAIMTPGGMKASVFYDYNDTNYYIDPNSSGTSLNMYGKRYNFATSRDWDVVGFGGVTNLHPQGHNQFWFGAGNGTWFTGTANSKTQASGLASDASYAHDLLISTMQSTSTYDRGITFAVDNTGAGNSGWRLGKWHSGDAADSSKLVVDGGLFVKGAYTDEYDYYADDYSAYYSSQSAPAFWSGGTNVPSITASTAIMIQSGNKGTSTRNPQLQFHQYGYGGVQFRYDGPNDRMYLEPLGANRFDWYRNQTDHGYIDFGPANTSHAHIYTDRANFYFNKQLTVSGGSQVNSGDVRASIFYDIDNTGYYANPASTSVFNDFRCDIMYDKDNTSYYVRPGSTSILNDARANIWYSRSNTGYYTDPEATSNINSLTTKGNVTFDLGTNSLYVKAVAGYGAYARFQDANTGTNQWNTGSYGNLMFTRYNTSVKEKKASSYKVWDYSSTNNGYLFSSTYTMKSVNRNYPALCLSSTYYASQQFIAFHNFTSGYKIGRISFNGTANVTYSTSGSDERLKENIVDWNENVSDKFETIQPKTFTFIHDVEEKRQKGFIAQNEYDKFPEAYPIDTEGFHEFNPSGMVVYLMKALQEQIKKTKELEQRLTDAGL